MCLIGYVIHIDIIDGFQQEVLSVILMFPNRLTEGPKNNNITASNRPSINNNPFSNAFTRVSKPQTRPAKQSVPAQSTGLNKYKKAPSTSAAPKGQFKKYMVEANNVFYEDRAELKELQRVRIIKWVLIIIWTLLASSYFLIRRITPYEGVCPPKATCGVFVHCPELYEYHKSTNQCRLSTHFLEEIESAARSRVEQLQLDYGQRECLGQEGEPSFYIKDLYEHIDGDKVYVYRQAAQNFFHNKENQQKYGFKVIGHSGLVKPTERHYTWRCRLLLAITDTFQLGVIVSCLIGLALAGWLGYLFMRSRRSSRIYSYLKQCVMSAEDKTLNISLARDDLQSRFGSISNEQWDRIDGLRASDKRIAYFEDDFLYWKAS